MNNIMNGKTCSEKIRQKIKEEVSILGRKPHLVDIQIGHNEASNIYIAGKEKAAHEVGMDFTCIRYEESVSEKEILDKIEELNQSDTIDGILIQFPVPKNFCEATLMNAVIPSKDVDGLTQINAGKLLQNKPEMISCTPKGIIALLDEYQIPIEGKNVVIVGRSDLVGKPLISLFLNRNATVTVCHSKTAHLEEKTREADILVVAVGKKHLIKEDMVKNGVVIIDVGINRENGKIYGDVDFEAVSKKAHMITPVPGGVGPMTITMLLENTLESYQKRHQTIH